MQVFHDSVATGLRSLASMLALWWCCPWCQGWREGGGQDWLSASFVLVVETRAELWVRPLREQILLLGWDVASSLVGGLLLLRLIEIVIFFDLAVVIVLNVEDQCSVWLLEQVLRELVHGLVVRILIVVTRLWDHSLLLSSLLWSFLGTLGSIWPGSWINLLLYVHLIWEILGFSTRRLCLIVIADTSFAWEVLREARFIDRLASSQYWVIFLGAYICASLLEVWERVIVVRSGDLRLLSKLCRVFDRRYLLKRIEVLASGVVFRGRRHSIVPKDLRLEQNASVFGHLTLNQLTLKIALMITCGIERNGRLVLWAFLRHILQLLALSEYASAHFVPSDGRSTATHPHFVQTFRRPDHILIVAFVKVGRGVVWQNASRLSAILNGVVESHASSIKIVGILLAT